MSNHVNDIEAFCLLLAKSGLVENDLIASIVSDFRANAAKSKFGASLTGFTSHLIAQGHLTCWQCGMLREQKYKGFFLDDFRLLDRLGTTSDHVVFLAVDRQTTKLVLLNVVHLAISRQKYGTDFHYSVEDFQP